MSTPPIVFTISQLTVSSHQLVIEAGRALHIPRNKSFCKLSEGEFEIKEYFAHRCPAYKHIGEYTTLYVNFTTKADSWHFGQSLLKLRSAGNQPLYYYM